MLRCVVSYLRMLRVQRILRNVAKSSTELPEVPPNVGVIFTSRSVGVRPFFVTGWKWCLMFGAMTTGLFGGQKLANAILTRSNPPNPLRIKGAEKPPSKHPHTPEE
jgi:hypothetical protein